MLAASICDYIHIHLVGSCLAGQIEKCKVVVNCRPPSGALARPLLCRIIDQSWFCPLHNPPTKHLYPMLAHVFLVVGKESTFGAQSSRGELTAASGEAMWHSTNFQEL